MCFSLQNLSVTYYLERGRNDNEPALEQLFDKLVKKALTHVENMKESHNNNDYCAMERRSGFLRATKRHPVGQKTEQPTHTNKLLCNGFINVCGALISHC